MSLDFVYEILKYKYTLIHKRHVFGIASKAGGGGVNYQTIK